MKSKKKNYIQEDEILQTLKDLLKDDAYNTQPGYSIDTETYPNHSVPFVDDHVNYLRKHPYIDPAHYLSNLRLMLKIR